MLIEHVKRNPNDDLELAKEYVVRVLLKDEYFARNFAQILKHLKALTAKRTVLRCSDGEDLKLPLVINLPNRMGINQRAEIVKDLSKHNFSYEMRIDDAFSHCRIIFFVHQVDEDSTTLSFGFTKIKNDKKSDKTDIAASETDIICSDVLAGNKNLWIA